MKPIFVTICLSLISFVASATEMRDELRVIEERISGRLGVSILDTNDGKSWDYNGNARFPMMSTFKTLACAKLLRDLVEGKIKRETEYLISRDDIIVWSPVTQSLVGKLITLENACEATMLTSDNTAANIILKHIGGPQAVTDFLRSIGDKYTQLDRIEPFLNEAKVDDRRDTTTPNAMVNSLNKIILGQALPKRSAAWLRDLMINNQVSNSLLRSVLPDGWKIADRSGAGNNGSRGITAVVWTEQRPPVIIAIYVTDTTFSIQERNEIIADIGTIIFRKLEINPHSQN